MILRKANKKATNGLRVDGHTRAFRSALDVRARRRQAHAGFSLLELVITLTVLTIMTLGVIPLIKTSVKRQREQQLREELREMRESIKQFHRDAAVPCLNAAGLGGGGGGGLGGGGGGGGGAAPYVDPRSKVCVSDPTIFGVDNPDHYPPTLDILKDGVDVLPRQPPASALLGNLKGNASDNLKLETTPKKKVYLREIPVDPMTGKAEWELRSVYDPADADSWGGQNVFDVHSKSKATSLNGETYSEW